VRTDSHTYIHLWCSQGQTLKTKAKIATLDAKNKAKARALTFEAKTKAKTLTLEAKNKAKALTFEAKTKATGQQAFTHTYIAEIKIRSTCDNLNLIL